MVDRFNLDAARSVAAKTCGRIFFDVWIRPLAQRACCVLKAVISMGSSAGHSTSGRYLNLPSLQLRTIAEVRVFGEGVVLPSAGIGDRLRAATCLLCR